MFYRSQQMRENAIVAGKADASDTWRLFYELMFSPQSHDRMHDICDALGLTPGLLKALLSMRPGEPRPMKDLAAEWRCDASYVTSLVDGLEERGAVERRPHPDDRRAKVIALTDKGERMRSELQARMNEPPPCFDVLSAEEVGRLHGLLAKLTAAAAPRDRRE
jgi:DNA-binding MarR family transcriptional regulator